LCSAAAGVPSCEDFWVPLFAPASGAPIISDDLEPGLLDSLVGEPRFLFEQLRDAADCLKGIPAELREAGFLTASVYAEAARRNLSYAAASITLDLRTVDPDGGDDWESLDPFLLEWLS
jgi:hypothetical protein